MKEREALKKILIVEHRTPLNGEDWIYISPKEWNVKDDFIVTKANNPIGWFDNLHDKDNYYTVIKTTEALEQSEPRLFSEGDKTFQECKDSIARIEMSAVNFNYNQNMGWWEWVRYCYPSEEQQKEAYNKAVKMFQSLSLKEWKEESANYVAKVCEKHFWGLVEITATGQEPKTNIQCLYCGASKNNGYFEKFSILPESSNPIATDHTTIEPNQTEAEKGGIEALATEIMDNEYSFFTPETRRKMVLLFCQGQSLARKQVIEEIEEFVKKESISATDEGGVFYENVIDSDYLLTKLQTLKQDK